MKTILITGASAGLGKATAKLFQSKGWRVIATMRSPEKETELNRLKNVTLLALDVTDTASVERAMQQAVQTAEINVVFNNAGYGLIGPLEFCSQAQIDAQINTNLTGALRLIRAFIPYFKEKRNGLFITTTSVFGFSSTPLCPVYNATKWALEGFSESISYDLAQHNIGIKTVAPGGIKSNFIKGMVVEMDNAYADLNTRMGELFADGTLVEFTDAEDIANVVYEAATDGKDQLRYLAGNDAYRIHQKRKELGNEGYRRQLTGLLHLKSPFQPGLSSPAI